VVCSLLCLSGKPVVKRQPNACTVLFVCHGGMYGVRCPKRVDPYVFDKACIFERALPEDGLKDCEVYP